MIPYNVTNFTYFSHLTHLPTVVVLSSRKQPQCVLVDVEGSRVEGYTPILRRRLSRLMRHYHAL